MGVGKIAAQTGHAGIFIISKCKYLFTKFWEHICN